MRPHVRLRLCFAALAVATAACTTAAPPPVRPALAVVVTRPRKVDLPIELRYPAELQAIQHADVQPMEIRGYVTKMLVDKGDVVKAGQVLAHLDCTPYADQRAKLEEAVRQAQVREKFAAETAARLVPMAAQNFVGAQDLEQAQAEAAGSDAALAHAQADVNEVQHQLDYCVLTAPFAGAVTMRYVDPGALVGPGNPVVSLDDDSAMRVFVNVVERDVASVRVGQLAALQVDAYPGRVFHGRVQRVVDALDPRTRTMLVEVDIPNPDGALKSGMFGRLAITVAVHKGAVVAPAAALQSTEDGTFVFVSDGHVAHRRKISLGYDDGNEVEVLKGLAADQDIVVSGQDLLGDGSRIEPHVDAEPEPSSATMPVVTAQREGGQ